MALSRWRRFILGFKTPIPFDTKSTVQVASFDEAEVWARADLADIKGQVLSVTDMCGYIGHTDDQGDFYTSNENPFIVVVTGGTPDHWVDNFLDPYWDVELVKPHSSVPSGSRLWIYGRSFEVVEKGLHEKETHS